MKQHFSGISSHSAAKLIALWGSIVTLVVGCSVAPNKPAPPPTPDRTPVTPPPVAPPVAATSPSPTPPVLAISRARTPDVYRAEVAQHLYAKNSTRIFVGKMPAYLYAVGVCETEIDPRGYVASLRWVRAPAHAPEVMAEIERTVRDAAPYPVPSRIGRVRLTETWLWDKSGRFQLHTLSEGQF